MKKKQEKKVDWSEYTVGDEIEAESSCCYAPVTLMVAKDKSLPFEDLVAIRCSVCDGACEIVGDR